MLLGRYRTQPASIVYGAITRYGTAFQRTSTSTLVSDCASHRQAQQRYSHDPYTATSADYHTI